MITTKTLDIAERLQKSMHESIDSMMKANKKLTREDCVTTFILVQMATLIESVAKPAAPSADAGKWVKGSERTINEVVLWRFTDKSSWGFDNLRINIHINGLIVTPKIFDPETIEWLDESAPQREGV